MLKIIFSLLFISSVYAGFYNLNGAKLQKLCQDPPPKWMIERIEKDLAPHVGKRLSRDDFEQTMTDVKMLICIKIQDNKVSWRSPLDFSKDYRLSRSLEMIKEMAEFIRLPDVEFLVTVKDCYDFPYYLQMTTVPVFTICKQERNHKAILWPEMRGYLSKLATLQQIKGLEKTLHWENKKPMAFWRGRSTGGYLNPYDWDDYPRSRLVLFSESYPGLVDARFSANHWIHPDMKEWLKEHYFGKYYKPRFQLQYKYQIAVDGFSFPSSLMWQLGANCTVIKNRTGYVEWYHEGIKEDVHYVSYDSDCYDLKAVIENLRANDLKAKQIAENATQFADEYLTAEGAALYLYLLFHHYAKISPEPDSAFCTHPV